MLSAHQTRDLAAATSTSGEGNIDAFVWKKSCVVSSSSQSFVAREPQQHTITPQELLYRLDEKKGTYNTKQELWSYSHCSTFPSSLVMLLIHLRKRRCYIKIVYFIFISDM